MSGRIRTYHELTGADASDLGGQVAEQSARVRRRLGDVDRVVAVASGKGGVGKSLLTAALATGAAAMGRRVGLLDADLDGPTAHRFLGVEAGGIRVEDGGAAPAAGARGVALLSMGLLLEEGTPLRWRGPEAHAFVWRGTRHRSALRELLSDVAWGRRELLLVDLPPGPGRLLDLHELIPGLSGVVAVTIPTEAARSSVERSLELCRERDLPILGIVENMAGYRCPACGETGPLFPGSAGATLSRRFAVPLLGRVPFDPTVAAGADRGDAETLLEGGAVGEALGRITRRLLEVLDRTEPADRAGRVERTPRDEGASREGRGDGSTGCVPAEGREEDA